MQLVYVIGYVKSGNTWTSRLLGDALNSPVIGVKNSLALATEGQKRTGNYKIEQGHVVPIEETEGPVIKNGNEIRYKLLTNEKVVFVVRHPFDVVVSVYYYWQFKATGKSMLDAINCVGKGAHPLHKVYNWNVFVNSWLDCEAYTTIVKYEDLLLNTEAEFGRMLNDLDVQPVHNISEVVFRQSFRERKKKVLTANLPYGSVIQNRLLRKGSIGDWKNHFTEESTQSAYDLFGKTMERLGYE